MLPFLPLAGPASSAEPVSGPALYLNEIPDAVQQAQGVDAGLDGWMGYSYANASLTATASGDRAVKTAERGALATALTAGVFTSATQVPVMDWKTTPATGLVAGTVTVRDGSAADQLDVMIHLIAGTPGQEELIRTDGSGWFGAVKLAPAPTGFRLSSQAPRARRTRSSGSRPD